LVGIVSKLSMQSIQINLQIGLKILDTYSIRAAFSSAASSCNALARSKGRSV
jgi:hypothetical protein